MLSKPLPDCFPSADVRHYRSKSPKKRTYVNVFGPQFSLEGRPQLFDGRLLARFTNHPPFGKVWLSSVCWSPSAKPGNEVECGIYGGWVKTTVHFEAVCGPKFMSFWDDIGDPLQFAMHLPNRLSSVSFGRYRPLKLPLSCKVVQKKVVFGLPICRGMGYPRFWTCFQNALTSGHVANCRWVPFSEFDD